MQPDFEKSAAAMVAGTHKAIQAAVAPLLKRIEQLEARPVPIDGKDGVGVAGALIDRSGVLVLTLSDGTTRDLGPVVGKDGSDGLSLDEYDEWLEDGGRTLVRRYECAESFKEFRHQTAMPIDRGVFKAGETYQPGDCVTWGGSSWIAQKETAEKPDGPDSGWRLAVKKGRDGKDSK